MAALQDFSYTKVAVREQLVVLGLLGPHVPLLLASACLFYFSGIS